jgi:chorismate mutase
MSLKKYRKEIDEIDKKILSLLEKDLLFLKR